MKKYRAKTCPSCRGYGHMYDLDIGGIYRATCFQCKGSGEIKVPMSNFDAIKEMDIKELTQFLYELCAIKDDEHKMNIRKWLEREAEV